MNKGILVLGLLLLAGCVSLYDLTSYVTKGLDTPPVDHVAGGGKLTVSPSAISLTAADPSKTITVTAKDKYVYKDIFFCKNPCRDATNWQKAGEFAEQPIKGRYVDGQGGISKQIIVNRGDLNEGNNFVVIFTCAGKGQCNNNKWVMQKFTVAFPECPTDCGTKKCDAAAQRCVDCLIDGDCPADKRCDSSTKTCVAKDKCQGVTCLAGKKCNPADGICVGCLEKADCSIGMKCSGAKTCVACEADSDCPSMTEDKSIFISDISNDGTPKEWPLGGAVIKEFTLTIWNGQGSPNGLSEITVYNENEDRSVTPISNLACTSSGSSLAPCTNAINNDPGEWTYDIKKGSSAITIILPTPQKVNKIVLHDTTSLSSHTRTVRVDFSGKYSYSVCRNNKCVGEISKETQMGYYTIITKSASAKATSITVHPLKGFEIGDEILIHQTTARTESASGNYEFNKIKQISGDIFALEKPLINNYDVDSNSPLSSVVVKVHPFETLTIKPIGVLKGKPFESNILPGRGALASWFGGILVIDVKGELVVDGKITVDSSGFPGGISSKYSSKFTGCTKGGSGMSPILRNYDDLLNCDPQSGGRGGDGSSNVCVGMGCSQTGKVRLAVVSRYEIRPAAGKDNPNAGGGGGSYGTLGTDGQNGVGYYCSGNGGKRGNTYGTQDLSRINLGSGGGAGGGNVKDLCGGSGGSGGGIIIIRAKSISGTGLITANGGNGGDAVSAGGGGSGGSILLISPSITVPDKNIQVLGGLAGNGLRKGGIGGEGRKKIVKPDLCTGVKCLSGQVCNPADGSCVQCVETAQCGGGKKCDATTHTCVDKCQGVSCSGSTPKCNPTTGTCVPCLVDNDCGAGKKRCISTNTCVDDLGPCGAVSLFKCQGQNVLACDIKPGVYPGVLYISKTCKDNEVCDDQFSNSCVSCPPGEKKQCLSSGRAPNSFYRSSIVDCTGIRPVLTYCMHGCIIARDSAGNLVDVICGGPPR